MKERAIEIMREFNENKATLKGLLDNLSEVLNPLTTIPVQVSMAENDVIAVTFQERYASEELHIRCEEYGFKFRLITGAEFDGEYSSMANMVQLTSMLMMNGAVREKVRDIIPKIARCQQLNRAILEKAERMLIEEHETNEQTAEN